MKSPKQTLPNSMDIQTEANQPQGHFQNAIDSSSRQISQRQSITQLNIQPNPKGLPTSLINGIQALSGVDVSDVQVHKNSSKPAQLNANAYAQGSNIYLASGQEQHLPHEAWHVVQQRQGRVQPTLQINGTAVNDNPKLEQEATILGGKAANYSAQLSCHSESFLKKHYGAVQLAAATVQRGPGDKSNNSSNTIASFGRTAAGLALTVLPLLARTKPGLASKFFFNSRTSRGGVNWLAEMTKTQKFASTATGAGLLTYDYFKNLLNWSSGAKITRDDKDRVNGIRPYSKPSDDE